MLCVWCFRLVCLCGVCGVGVCLFVGLVCACGLRLCVLCVSVVYVRLCVCGVLSVCDISSLSVNTSAHCSGRKQVKG